MTKYAHSADLTGANQWLVFTPTNTPDNNVTRFVEADGTFTATLSIEVSYPDDTGWRDIGIPDNTQPFFNNLHLPSVMMVRVGIKSGNYTSGTASVSIA